MINTQEPVKKYNIGKHKSGRLKTVESPLMEKWLNTLNKPSTAKTYRQGLLVLLKHVELTPEQLTKRPLSWIEEKTEEVIHARRKGKNALSPKYLNVVFNSVKSLCLYVGMIKNGHQFKQIRFDKHSRSTRDRAMITPRILRQLLDHADIREKCIVGLYGIHGLRPSLIPQVLVEDVRPEDIDIERLTLKDKSWIWVKREYRGNKGNIDFPVILTSETAAWLSEHLQHRKRKGEEITPKSQLVKIPSLKSVRDHINKLFKRVGFEGRNYLLRHYANVRMKKAYSDPEFKEWCMGHAERISSVYMRSHFLSDEEINDFKNSIDETPLLIYGISKSDLEKAEMLEKFVKNIGGLSTEQLKKLDDIRKSLQLGKISLQQFEENLAKITKRALDAQMESKFETMFKRMAKKNGIPILSPKDE